MAASPVQVQCAGRTDAGVHALLQVAHFDVSVEREDHAWVLGGNANLPAGISILWAVNVVDDFHARFSATGRTYRYVILNRRARPGLLQGRVSWEYRPLQVARMIEASGALIGEHDFTSYRAVACQAKSPIRDVRRLEISQQGEFIVIEIEANAFLHHMVRNIAGVLMAIGMGKEKTAWAAEVLAARDRTLGGVTAPADGLYLVDVQYPSHYQLPVSTVPGKLLLA